MDDIKFSCQKCGGHLIIDKRGAGSSVVCNHCGARVIVPNAHPPVMTTPQPPQDRQVKTGETLFAAITCSNCRAVYRIGVDSYLTLGDLGVDTIMPIFGALSQMQGQSEEEKSRDWPDGIKHSDLKGYRENPESMAEMRQYVVTRADNVRSGTRRYWRCGECDTIQEYLDGKCDFFVSAPNQDKSEAPPSGNTVTCPSCGHVQREGDWEREMDRRAKAQGMKGFVNLSAPPQCLKCETALDGSDLKKQEVSGVCDICNQTTSTGSGGRVFKNKEMKRATEAGFNGMAVGPNAEMLAMAGISKNETYGQWKQKVMLDTTDWLLCPSCQKEIAPFSTTAGVAQPALEHEVRELIRAGKKIEAIKLYREKTGVGLKEAKDAVEQCDFSGLRPIPVHADGTPEKQALTLLRAGKKIEAIKLWRERTGRGLKDSKDAVEALARAHNIEVKSESGCFIATAVCGGESHEVLVLRRFRDTILARTCVGRSIIAAYSVSSPPLAQILARHSGLKRLTAAMVIRPISRLVERRYNSANNRVEPYGA